MRYIIHFASQKTIEISEEEKNALQARYYFDGNRTEKIEYNSPLRFLSNKCININHIEFIEPIEESTRGIVSSPKPDDVRQKKEGEKAKTPENTAAILKGVEKKYDE